MTGQEFLRAVTVAFIATFVATVYGYWEVLFGLPKLDFASVLGRRLVPEGSSPEFVFNWGMAQHFIDSIILGVLYAQFFHPAYRWSHWASGFDVRHPGLDRFGRRYRAFVSDGIFLVRVGRRGPFGCLPLALALGSGSRNSSAYRREGETSEKKIMTRTTTLTKNPRSY
jgi:hypothetical protein